MRERAKQLCLGYGFSGLLLLVCLPVLALEPGSPFPDYRAPLLNGSATTGTGDYLGKVVYVDIWASWCPPCRVALPVLQNWRQRYAEAGFEVLGVTVDTDLEAARHALRRAAVEYPVIHGLTDSQLQTIGVQTMPSAYLLDRQGRVQHIHEGFRSSDAWELEARIEALLEQH